MLDIVSLSPTAFGKQEQIIEQGAECLSCLTGYIGYHTISNTPLSSQGWETLFHVPTVVQFPVMLISVHSEQDLWTI